MKKRKLMAAILNNPAQVRFADLMAVALWLGFSLERISGSYHILVHRQTGAMLNLQAHGDQAKPYQVRQFLKLVEEYRLTPVEADE